MFLLPQQISLFEGVSDPSFQSQLDGLPLRRLPKGFAIFEEHESSTEVYVVLSGAVEIVRKSPEGELIFVARLESGEIFGEFSFLTGSPRTTSAVILEEASLLEISAPWLKSISGKHPVIEERLNALYRSRVLTNILKSTRIFAPLKPEQLDRIISRMVIRKSKEGEYLIQEGAQGNDLYVVKRGKVLVTKLVGNKSVLLDELGPGSVLGEMALVTGEPRSASARAASDCEIIVMPSEIFKSVLEESPKVLKIIEDIVRSRSEQIRQSLESVVQEIVPERWSEDEEQVGIQVASLKVSVSFVVGDQKINGILVSISSRRWTIEPSPGSQPFPVGTSGVLNLSPGRMKDLRDLSGEPLPGTVVEAEPARMLVAIQDEVSALKKGTSIMTALARARVRMFVYPSYDASNANLILAAHLRGKKNTKGKVKSMSQTHGHIEMDGSWIPGDFAAIQILQGDKLLASCNALCLAFEDGVAEIQFEYETSEEKSALEAILRDISKRQGYGHSATKTVSTASTSTPAISTRTSLTLTKHFRSPQEFVRAYFNSMEAGHLRVESKDALPSGSSVRIQLAIADGKKSRRIACTGVVHGWNKGVNEIRLDNRSGQLAGRLQQICKSLIDQHSTEKWETRKKGLAALGIQIMEAPNWWAVSSAAAMLGIAIYSVSGYFMSKPSTLPAQAEPQNSISQESVASTVQTPPSRRVGDVPKRTSTKAEKMNITEIPPTADFVESQKKEFQEGLSRQVAAAKITLSRQTDPQQIAEMRKRIELAEQAMKSLDSIDPKRPSTWSAKSGPENVMK